LAIGALRKIRIQRKKRGFGPAGVSPENKTEKWTKKDPEGTNPSLAVGHKVKSDLMPPPILSRRSAIKFAVRKGSQVFPCVVTKFGPTIYCAYTDRSVCNAG
jgi:hypothetical protein